MSTAFQLVAGSLPLDFANTLDNRGDPAREEERLRSYSDLLAFLRQSDAIHEALARKLNARAAREPRAAAAFLGRARSVREAINRVFAAIASGESPAAKDLDMVNEEISAAARHTRLQPAGTTFAWTWSGEADALERALWPILRGAAELLTSDQLERVRVCEAITCRWVFLDTSRNRTRRWCDMKLCGNRAKARRFYERQKDTA